MRKTFTKLFAVALMSAMTLSAAAADEVVSIVFSQQGLTNKAPLSNLTVSGITLNGDKGSISTAPEYRSQYEGVAFFATNTLTITSARYINKIEFTTPSVLPFEQQKVYADAGAIVVTDDENAVWTNNMPVKNLVITPISNTIAEGMVITSMKIYLSDDAGQAKKPVIAPEGGVINADTDITISTDEEGAVIYYTTDGTTPLTGYNTKRYSGVPFRITSSCVVKALAIVDGKLPSNVEARGYVVPITLTSLSQLKNATPGTFYDVMSDITVTYRLGSTCWLKDETGVIKLYGDAVSNARLASGDKLTHVTGRYHLDRNTPEMDYVMNLSATPGTAAAEPKVLKAKEITSDNINEYVMVKDARLTQLSSVNYTLTDASGAITVMNNYHLSADSILTDSLVNVCLFPAWYGSELRFYMAKVIDPNAVPDDPNDPPKENDGLTAETAWTVAEAFVKGKPNFQAKEWVKGYIVGSFPTQGIGSWSTYYWGVENADQMNIIIADSPDCRDFSQCFKICMIQPGSVPSATNLKDHPEMLGKYIAYHGNMASNYQCMTVPDDYKEVNPTQGVNTIDGDNAPKAYYTLSGLRVAEKDLRDGEIYLCRQGSKCEKVVYRK